MIFCIIEYTLLRNKNYVLFKFSANKLLKLYFLKNKNTIFTMNYHNINTTFKSIIKYLVMKII